MNLDSRGKYLGCPIYKGRSKMETFSELVDKSTESYKPRKQNTFVKQEE